MYWLRKFQHFDFLQPACILVEGAVKKNRTLSTKHNLHLQLKYHLAISSKWTPTGYHLSYEQIIFNDIYILWLPSRILDTIITKYYKWSFYLMYYAWKMHIETSTKISSSITMIQKSISNYVSNWVYVFHAWYLIGNFHRPW